MYNIDCKSYGLDIIYVVFIIVYKAVVISTYEMKKLVKVKLSNLFQVF